MNAERTTLAYLFGFAGTLPFLWGAVTQFVQIPLSANLLGAQLQVTYGIVILPICQAPIGISQRDINRVKARGLYFCGYACPVAFCRHGFVPQHLHLALMIGFRCLLVDRYFAMRCHARGG